MSFAWETTVDDVRIALATIGVSLDEAEANAIRVNLDLGAIEKAALRGNDMDAQTESAHDEIRRQFRVSR
jgi:hypothetical protein